MAEAGDKKMLGVSPEPDAHLRSSWTRLVDCMKKSGEYVVLTKEEFNSFSCPVGSSTPAPK